MSIVGEAYEILKDLKLLSDKHKDKEILNKVIELQNKFYELKEENENLKSQIAEYENTAELEKDLELLPSGVYIRKSEKEAGKDIRYCPACFRNRHKLYPIVSGNLRRNRFCSNCNTPING